MQLPVASTASKLDKLDKRIRKRSSQLDVQARSCDGAMGPPSSHKAVCKSLAWNVKLEDAYSISFAGCLDWPASLRERLLTLD